MYKMTIVFATNNEHKVQEIRSALPPAISIVTLKEAGILIDIPEPYATLEENAAAKARTIHQMTGGNCFSEDTGLEVYALNNEPGVKSARYAGQDKAFEKNVEKLLLNLKGIEKRTARFRTVICLLLKDREHFFEGICEGKITEAPQGSNGFGYDPVFIPVGDTRTFAEMSLQEKNTYSHRRKALDKLVLFLNNLNVNEQY